MSNQTLEKDPYIQELMLLEKQYPERMEFHKKVEPLLLKMGKDKEFLKRIVRRNFDDEGYLQQEWSLYNIPYFHVYETDDFILKVHFFPKGENWVRGIAAHAIHHHNNYILTTNAFFGSGYETILFDKNVVTDPKTLRTTLKISKHFHQKDWNPSRVDAWEPHIVFIPEKFSATLLIWTPEKKRSTDTLKNVGLLKAIKGPLRKIIQMFKMESVFGIAKGNTYQYYAAPDGKGFMAIEEEEYFAPTKAAKGPDVDDYSMQMVFAFLQEADLLELEYLKEFRDRATTPPYYKKWIDKVLNGENVPEVFHRTEINIPQKTYTIQDIYKCAGEPLPQNA